MALKRIFSHTQSNGSQQPSYKFTCECSAELERHDELANHRKTCEAMQEKYGKLFDSLDEHVDEISKKNNYEEWKNVRAFYEIFKGKFISNI